MQAQQRASSPSVGPTLSTAATPQAGPDAAQLAEFDGFVEAVRKQFDVPGIAVAIVQDGKVVMERGYGVR